MPIVGFDHFIVVVHNLEHAVDAYRRLGFDARLGGEHPAWGSHNAVAAFADGSYLELVAFTDKALAAGSFWADAYRKLGIREGFVGFVLASDDLDKDVHDTRARGLAIEQPRAGARSRPDSQRVAWRTAVVGETAFGVLPFLIQDETPRRLRIERAREGLGSRARVREVLVGVPHAGSAFGQYSALLGTDLARRECCDEGRDQIDIALPWGRIALAQPGAGEKALAEETERRGTGLFLLTLGVEDLEHELFEASERGLQLEQDDAGFLLPHELACGARIKLIQNQSPPLV